MTLRFLPLFALPLLAASCADSLPSDIRPQARGGQMATPTSMLNDTSPTPMALNNHAQLIQLRKQSADYRRQANLATGEERERLLQNAERVDTQAAQYAPR